jgi:hypothetical protein
MLGLEPQKRSKNGPPKAKAAKPKKDSKTKREDGVKSEPGLDGLPDESVRDRSPPTTLIKQEQPPANYQSQFTPTPAPSPSTLSVLDCHSGMAGRLLTPCSDDMMSAAHAMPMSPTSDMFASHHSAFDLPTPHHGGLSQAHDEHTHPHALGHTHGSWAHSPVYSAFDAAMDMGHYDANICEHQRMRNHHTAESHDADAIGEPDGDPVVIIKREDIDPHSLLRNHRY